MRLVFPLDGKITTKQQGGYMRKSIRRGRQSSRPTLICDVDDSEKEQALEIVAGKVDVVIEDMSI
jgi:hypothetical protein